MHCVSTRAMAALAYERGEEFDPAMMPTPELVEDLGSAMGAMPLIVRARLLRAPPPTRARAADAFPRARLVLGR